MRSKFPSYFPLTDDERKQVWDQAIFSVDANVLLNVYRVNANTGENLLRIYESISEKLWISHQAAQEYLQNRVRVIEDVVQGYAGAKKKLNDLKGQVESLTQQLTRHPLIDAQEMSKKLNASIEASVKDIENKKTDHPKLMKRDTFLEAYEARFDGKVGEPFSKEELQQIYDEAATKFENGEGPGHKDDKKPGNKKYGDYVIWKQLIAKCDLDKKPLIFVIDDQKSDWWHIVDGKRIGPSHELIEEFFDETGQAIHMYSMDKFMEHARTILNIDVAEEAIEDVLEVSSSTSVANSVTNVVRQHWTDMESAADYIEEEEWLDPVATVVSKWPIWKPSSNDTNSDRKFKWDVIEKGQELGYEADDLRYFYKGVHQVMGPLGALSQLTNLEKRLVIKRLKAADHRNGYTE